MARARNIKPGFFENEELAELPFEARLLFIGLWTLADKKGRLEHRPKRIKAQLFPYDSVQLEKLLEHLRHARFISLYEVEGQEYVQIDNFVKHQNPHKNEKDSGLPGPNENNGLENNRDDSSNYASSTEKIGTTRADSLIPDSGFLKREGASAPPPTNGHSRRFIPPTVEQVREYVTERGSHVDPEQFCDFYSSKGWKIGKDKMTDWKAAVRTWEKRHKDEAPQREQQAWR